MFLKFLLVVLAFLASFTSTKARLNGFVVNCYFEVETAFTFSYDDINYDICSHVYVAYAEVDASTGAIVGAPTSLMDDMSKYRDMMNNQTSLILSVGGWRMGAGGFSKIAADPALRIQFAASALTLLNNHNFDGIDIAWMLPCDPSGSAADGVNLGLLLGDLKRQFLGAGKINYQITATVAANPVMAGNPYCYDIPSLVANTDFINVMTYDFHLPTDGITGNNSPLRASENDTIAARGTQNCDSALENWHLGGVPREQMTLTIPFHGHTYELVSPYDHGIGAPATTGRNGGTMFYDEICKLADFNYVFDEQQVVPYKFLNNEWISYDNTESVRYKVDYAANWALQGVSIWAVNYDDKEAMCGPSLALLFAVADVAPPRPTRFSHN